MIYEFLANGFELVEAMTPLDMLRRGGKEVLTVSITDSYEVTSSNGVTVKSDRLISKLPSDIPEAVILPGGMPGASNLKQSQTVCDITVRTANAGGLVAAICAAPSLLGAWGMLSGKRAICYPGFEEKLTGAIIAEKKPVRDGNIITAPGAGAAMDFALLLVASLYGEETSENLRKAVLA